MIKINAMLIKSNQRYNKIKEHIIEEHKKDDSDDGDNDDDGGGGDVEEEEGENYVLIKGTTQERSMS